MSHFAHIRKAIADVRKGKMLIIVDNPGRENEGDLYMAAENITPAAINAMIKHGGGLICVAMTEARALRLDLPLMIAPEANNEKTGVNFTVSFSARRGVKTGISAYDRARTIRATAHSGTQAKDLVRPGHVLGLVARAGGVLERQGHTEAAVDLARLAGKAPLGVLCEIVGKSGQMAKRIEIAKLARTLGIKIVAIDDLVEYLREHRMLRLARHRKITRIASSKLPTRYGTFTITAYRSLDGREHAALVLGKPGKNPLVRVHSQCLTGDTLFSERCDCGGQLETAIRRIGKEGSGVIVYASQEGRGIGLGNKIRAYALQDDGLDTVEANLALGFSADHRTYEAVAHILEDVGAVRMRLLTNNPKKAQELTQLGINVTECIPIETKPHRLNRGYLKTKKQKLGHHLTRV